MWDVFVSHRGPDTKRNFVEYLQLALPGRNIFVDRVSLRKADVGWETIVGALSTARIVLIVLSPEYQRSFWCLEELRIAFQQREQGKADIHVVAFGTGVQKIDMDALNDSLQQWQQHYGAGNPLADWQDALQYARGITGSWHNPKTESLPDLVNEVARDIERNLPPREIGSSSDKIGLQRQLDRIFDILQNQTCSVRTFGLWGMGGAGKTTMAEALRNVLSREFSVRSTCYLKGMRNQAQQPEGYLQMQKKLLTTLVDHYIPIPVNNIEGLEILRAHLQQWKVLLILDDVDDGIISRTVDISGLGKGSIVIATTRNRRALDSQGFCVESVQVHQPAESRLIFLQQACRRGEQVISLRVSDEMVDEVVEYCGGLPLSLKVMGALLRGKGERIWEELLKKLRKAGTLAAEGENIFDQLRISFESLSDPTHKDMFLDVACFFFQKQAAVAKSVWRGREWDAESGLHTLSDLCLITVDSAGILDMHDHLRDLGQRLEKYGQGDTHEALSWDQRKRLWENSDELLEGRLFELQTVRGFTQKHLPRLKASTRLDCLDLQDDMSLKAGILRYWCPSWWLMKRSLKMHSMSNLRYLVLESWPHFRTLPKELGHLLHLKVLRIMNSEVSGPLPPQWATLKELEMLDLSENRLSGGLPPQWATLKKLETLDLSSNRLSGSLPPQWATLKSWKHLTCQATG